MKSGAITILAQLYCTWVLYCTHLKSRLNASDFPKESNCPLSVLYEISVGQAYT